MMDELTQKALAAVEAEVPRVSHDSSRPAFHFRPPAQWMNDVCGAFFYEGWYHIFFQFNPWSDECRGCGWGHARSRDLVFWEFLPPALLPSEATGDKGNASGSAAFNAQGEPVLFFGWTPIEYPERPREQWAAVPVDKELIRWRRIDIGLAPGKSGVPAEIDPIWTDMFVFHAENRCFAVFKSSDGLLCEAQNEELTAWKAVGHIDGVDGECPNLFPLEDRFVLLRSTYPISYQVGDFDPETKQFRAKNGETHVLDYAYGSENPGQWMLNHHRPRSMNFHRGLYGTTVFNDSEGRCILLGWVSGFKTGRGWNGCMSLPRVLSLTDGDRLVNAPV
ncbi:MAG: glycoside hydrolase family 32 protein, partial [Candidatus Poribacteria bacterium]|nr:glycoside hydrolase family 32 protein [Candidatus Poribacteria bacterium]